MSSEIITPLANALVDKLGDVGATGYRWAPKEVFRPAGVVELPAIERTPVDAPEDHLGQKDWTLNFPVIFYFELAVAQGSQDAAADIVEAFVSAIDADQGLGGLCQEAKVVEVFEPEFLEDANPQIRWPARVQILKFVG